MHEFFCLQELMPGGDFFIQYNLTPTLSSKKAFKWPQKTLPALPEVGQIKLETYYGDQEVKAAEGIFH